MKRLFLLFFSALLCTAVSAHDFEVDGIYYNITSSSDLTVAITYAGNSYNSAVYSGSVVIPEKVTYNNKEYSVTSIEYAAFRACWGLTSVTIPNSVTSIGSSAFDNCSGLTSVTIPNSVISIGDGAFSGCSGLASIKVSEDNKVYDSRNGCNAIIETATNKLIVGCKTTVIPDSVTSIGEYAFSGCSGLTSITIPDSVTSIGNYAFSGCSGLTSVTIGNSVTSIGEYAFSGCSGLTAVHITDLSAWCKIQFVKDYFYGEYSNPTYYAHHLYLNGDEIINLVIPDDVTSIGEYAFSGCSGLTSVTIPNSVTNIGVGAFITCI